MAEFKLYFNCENIMNSQRVFTRNTLLKYVTNARNCQAKRELRTYAILICIF